MPLLLTWARFFSGRGKCSRVGTEIAFAGTHTDSSPNVALLQLCLSFLEQSVSAQSEVVFAWCKLLLTQASMEDTPMVITHPWFRISYCKAGEETRREPWRVPPALRSISSLARVSRTPLPHVCTPHWSVNAQTTSLGGGKKLSTLTSRVVKAIHFYPVTTYKAK